jgi:threonyl-tRNA synthetase
MAGNRNHEEESEFLHKLRHSTAHVMAQAVVERFPEARIAIGPPIKDGFYYDFDLGRDADSLLKTFSPEDLEAIEQRMRQIVAGRFPFVRKEVTAAEAKSLFADQPYKLELIEGLERGGVDEYGEPTAEAPVISTYQHDHFVDLCRGPHLEHAGQIPPDAFKLLTVAGAYWRGDEHNPMLQRIYGTVWPSRRQLEAYLEKLEEARRRDHRRLGKDLDLFSVNPDEVGGGLVLWHPRGGLMRHLAEEFCKNEHLAGGYDMVYTPHIGRAALWQTSGHLEFYEENMYAPIDIEGQEFYLKPMNCPFHMHIYKSRTRSYRDLPMRLAEWGAVYRFERSGVLHGLTRVRGFTQDDAHLFCRPDQMPAEIDRVLHFCLHILRSFGFVEFNAYLSTRPAKSVGQEGQWEAAERALEAVLSRAAIPFQVDKGGGAFYGPKIDLKINDALGREWQVSTIQFDFNLPDRFDLTYVGEDGEEHRPYVIHRALLGSMERFFGLLIEHFGGAFPVWISAVQAAVIPIADRHNEPAIRVVEQLKAARLRVEVDDSADRMNAKIRRAQLQKIPYMLVIGDREAGDGTVNVRFRTGEQRGIMTVAGFADYVQEVVRERALI